MGPDIGRDPVEPTSSPQISERVPEFGELEGWSAEELIDALSATEDREWGIALREALSRYKPSDEAWTAVREAYEGTESAELRTHLQSVVGRMDPSDILADLMLEAAGTNDEAWFSGLVFALSRSSLPNSLGLALYLLDNNSLEGNGPATAIYLAFKSRVLSVDRRVLKAHFQNRELSKGQYALLRQILGGGLE